MSVGMAVWLPSLQESLIKQREVMCSYLLGDVGFTSLIPELTLQTSRQVVEEDTEGTKIKRKDFHNVHRITLFE